MTVRRSAIKTETGLVVHPPVPDRGLGIDHLAKAVVVRVVEVGVEVGVGGTVPCWSHPHLPTKPCKKP